MSSLSPSHANGIPTSLSRTYWSTWAAQRQGASVVESLESADGEEWIGGWDGVGLYEGNNKIPSYQSLTVHLTSHRLILIPIPDASPQQAQPSTASAGPSIQTHLSNVRQTEFYNGFMRSSAKITLILGLASQAQGQPAISDHLTPGTTDQPASAPTAGSSYDTDSGSWTCRVCGYVNTSLGRVASASKCGLCGVPHSTSQASVPPSRSSTPVPATPALAPAPASASTASDALAQPVDEEGRIACPACTFLNSPFLPNCEICSTALPNSKAKTRAPRKKDEGRTQVVRLSFRKGGEKEAYKRLKAVLGDKAWERGGTAGARNAVNHNGVEEGSSTPSRPGAGIDGILQTIDLNAKSQDAHMNSAFADLEALMLRAGEMVRLAQALNNKLTSQQASSANAGTAQPSEEEATMIRTSLVQLGLAAPALTQDMVRDERRYHQGLARELGELLTGRAREREGLMIGDGGRGVIGLDEVWGLWMRARGIALLSPSTLISILPYLPSNTTPSIQSLILPSSLHVLHTPAYSSPAILSRTLDRLSPTSRSVPDADPTEGEPGAEKSFSILEFAAFESLPIGLAQELLQLIEKEGGLVRDDQASAAEGGTRWYRDIIEGWPV